MQLDGLTLFGLLSVTAMLVFYALEHRSFRRRVHCRLRLWVPARCLALRRCRTDLGGSQAMAGAEASDIADLKLRKQWELLEPQRFVEAVHQVEVLQRLAGRALHQIVDGRDHDGSTRQTVGEYADMAEIRAPYMLRRRDHPLLHHMNEGARCIGLGESGAEVIGGGFAGKRGRAGPKIHHGQLHAKRAENGW